MHSKPVPSKFMLLLDSFASSLYAQATADMSVGSIVGGSAGNSMSSSAKTPLTFVTSLTSQRDLWPAVDPSATLPLR